MLYATTTIIQKMTDSDKRCSHTVSNNYNNDMLTLMRMMIIILIRSEIKLQAATQEVLLRTTKAAHNIDNCDDDEP